MLKNLPVFIFLVSFKMGFSQIQSLKGLIKANDNIEGIHIINSSKNKFTISNHNGEFTIQVEVNDTLLFKSIQYKPLKIPITQLIISSGNLNVHLNSSITALDEVIIGNTLTGNLITDIANDNSKPGINFYNLGIPGYKGKQKTVNERKLSEATSGGGIIPLNPILNWISGRTKRLKKQVERDSKNMLINELKRNYNKILFESMSLPIHKRAHFYYYASDDPNFKKIAKSKNGILILEFLTHKLEAFKTFQKLN